MQLFWLLFWLTIQKGEVHKKAIYGREIIHHAYSFVKSFCRDFLKIFFLHTAPTIPKLDVLLYLIAWDKSKAILNCRLFAFALKMIFNLILKLNLKMNSNSKLVLNLIFNLKMFRLWRACASRET